MGGNEDKNKKKNKKDPYLPSDHALTLRVVARLGRCMAEDNLPIGFSVTS